MITTNTPWSSTLHPVRGTVIYGFDGKKIGHFLEHQDADKVLDLINNQPAIEEEYEEKIKKLEDRIADFEEDAPIITKQPTTEQDSNAITY